MNVGEAVLSQGIASDAAYVSRLASDLRNPRYASFSPVVSLCMPPYMSLFAHESYRKLVEIDPALASALSDEVQAIVAKSRHSLKLFEDNRRGVEGQIAYFRDELLPAHTSRFLGNTWLPLARPLEKDLGLYSYEKRLIATTHGSNFFMGIDPGTLLSQSGAETRAIYEQYGQYFGGLGAQLVEDGQTFVGRLDPQRFNQWPKDVRAAKYYGRVFDGASSPDLNAVLTVFRGMMNFIDRVITAGTTADEIEYTVFKIRFLTLYAILRSLTLLRDEQLHSLTAQSASFIDKIVSTAQVQAILGRPAKPFRNTLMHYALDSRIDTARVDLADPLFGLVPIYFPAHDTTTFAAMVGQCITETASVMEEWAGA